MVVACWANNTSTIVAPGTWTITDNKGGTGWTQGLAESDGGHYTGATSFTKYLASGQTGMTVTVGNAGGASGDFYMACRVDLGANSSQSGAGNSQFEAPGNTNIIVDMTTTTTGSWVYICGCMYGPVPAGGLAVYSAATTNISNTVGTGTFPPNLAVGKQTSATGTPGTQYLGWTTRGASPGSCIGIEVLAGSASSPVTVNLPVGRVNVAGPALTPIIGHGVALPTGRVLVQGYTPTVTAAKAISGGKGADGNIKITYISAATQALASSISPIATTDPYGNAVPVGYQGPIAAIHPGSSPSTVETWQGPLALTNAVASGQGVSGFWYHYRSDNTVELLWDITLSVGAGVIGTLPTAYRPLVTQNIRSSWYGTGPTSYSNTFAPALSIATNGQITVQNCNNLAISLCGHTRITMDGSL